MSEFNSPNDITNLRNNQNNSRQLSNSTKPYVIPIVGEKYLISKREIQEDLVIEKRLQTKDKTITVPVQYEEVYIDGKKWSTTTNEIYKIMSSIKEAISKDKDTDNRNLDVKLQEYKAKDTDKLDSLFDNDVNDLHTIERIIPIYEEQIEINKKIVKVGEIVVKKRPVTENKKVKINTTQEKLKIALPDGVVKDI